MSRSEARALGSRWRKASQQVHAGRVPGQTVHTAECLSEGHSLEG